MNILFLLYKSIMFLLVIVTNILIGVWCVPVYILKGVFHSGCRSSLEDNLFQNYCDHADMRYLQSKSGPQRCFYIQHHPHPSALPMYEYVYAYCKNILQVSFHVFQSTGSHCGNGNLSILIGIMLLRPLGFKFT